MFGRVLSAMLARVVLAFITGELSVKPIIEN